MNNECYTNECHSRTIKTEHICSDKNLKWADGKVKVIGAWFCIDCEESKKKNYEEKVHKVEDILNNWRNKRLTSTRRSKIVSRAVGRCVVMSSADHLWCAEVLQINP